MKPRLEPVCAALALALCWSVPVRADTLPDFHEVVPRKLELRGVEQFEDLLLVLSPCAPPGGLDYCVVESGRAFAGSGTLYALRKRYTKTRKWDSAGAARIAEWGQPVVEIYVPKVGIDGPGFFGSDTRVVRTGIDLGNATMVLHTKLRLASLLDVRRISRNADGKFEVRQEKLVWTCDSGVELVRAPQPDGGALEPPSCPPAAEPPTLPSGLPTLPPPRPGEVLVPASGGTPAGLVLAGFGALGLLVAAGVFWGLRR